MLKTAMTSKRRNSYGRRFISVFAALTMIAGFISAGGMRAYAKQKVLVDL